MNQKEYELIAEVLNDMSCELMEAGLYDEMARAFELKLMMNYKSFDGKKFLKACGATS